MTGARRDALLARWRAGLRGAALDGAAGHAIQSAVGNADADAAGADLLARWSEPARRYHTIDHLTFMLDVVDAAASFASDVSAVRVATWFHDAVYDPTAREPGFNERASADLAAATLPALGIARARVAEVVRLVLLTADHRVEPGDRNGALLADADLAILGADAERYAGYVDAIRDEYAHVPDDVFAAGRSAVLAGLLDLDPIYHLAPHREAWEARARANVRAELTTLRPNSR